MTTSLGKRSATNGISDIAYKDEKSPIYTSTDQFIQGTKTFSGPIKALGNVLCSGYYYGDGSHLTNVTGLDPTKLPLTGGTLTGPLSIPSPNQSIEISEIGIRTNGANGETKLNSDVLFVHPGQGVRSQLAATSIDFNNDGADEYVAVGTNTMIGNVSGLLAVDASVGASLFSGLNTSGGSPYVPTVRLASAASGTETVCTAISNQIKLEDVGIGEYVKLGITQLTYNPPGGAAASRNWSDIVNPAGGVPTIDQVLGAGNSATDKHQYMYDSGQTYSTHLSGSGLEVNDGAGYLCLVNTSQILQVDGVASKTLTLAPNSGLTFNPNPWAGVTTHGETGIVMTGADYSTNHTISGISIERVSTTQMTYYTEGVLNITNSTVNYTFSNDHKFFKWDAGTSLRVNSNDTHVERDHAFKVSDDGTPFNFNPYTEYLDDQNNPGWSVLLSNCNGADVTLQSPDVEFYSHATGPSGTSFNLKKWATARVTLVPTNTFSYGYAWAVSMY